MFHIKNMSAEDFEFAVRLTDTMDWGFIEEDFEFMTQLEPDGCFILLYNSEKAGLATAISYGKIGWLGNIIVSERHRGKGGGSLLVRYATEYLERKGVETIGLYSYLDRVPFYERRNFRFDSEFMALKGKGFPSSSETCVREADEDDVSDIVNLDGMCFGESRGKLLRRIILDPDNLCYVGTESGRILGFAAAKVYGRASQIGPLVCEKERYDVAMDILKVILSRLEGYDIYLYIPRKETWMLDLLTQHGFKENFRLARMFRGTPIVSNHIYLAESLERG